MTSIEELQQKLMAAQHAMQTGVAYMMTYEPSSTEPKHLRVGVNTALVDACALASLLIKKGIITEEEYYQALIEAMEQEVERYTGELKKHFGRDDLDLKLL